MRRLWARTLPVRAQLAFWRHEGAHLLYCPVSYLLDPEGERDIPRWLHPHPFPMALLQRMCNRYERKWRMQ